MLVLGTAEVRRSDLGAGIEVVGLHAGSDWPAVQLGWRADAVALGADTLGPPERCRAVLHCAVRHTRPGGLVLLLWEEPPAEVASLPAEFDLRPVAPDDPSFTFWSRELENLPSFRDQNGGGGRAFRRTERFTVHDLVAEAAAEARRVTADELAARLAGPEPPLVVDTRTPTDRQRFGVIAGSVHVPRTVLEWHLDPANGYRHPAISSFDQPLVIVCNGGYSSVLAAANLRRIGFTDVADLAGGVHGWVAAGLPVQPPDHAHLDL